MRQFSQEEGIFIDDEILELINKGIERSGNIKKFAEDVNVPYSSMFRWVAGIDKEKRFMPWFAVKNIRLFLEQNGILEKDNYKWLVPTEIRAILLGRYDATRNAIRISVRETVLLDELRKLSNENRTLVEKLVYALSGKKGETREQSLDGMMADGQN